MCNVRAVRRGECGSRWQIERRCGGSCRSHAAHRMERRAAASHLPNSNPPSATPQRQRTTLSQGKPRPSHPRVRSLRAPRPYASHYAVPRLMAAKAHGLPNARTCCNSTHRRTYARSRRPRSLLVNCSPHGILLSGLEAPGGRSGMEASRPWRWPGGCSRELAIVEEARE